MHRLPAGGTRLAAYGAAAKGATLLNYTRFESVATEYVVDANPAQVGEYMPGVKLPSAPSERSCATSPIAF